jgi:hypothetical protein
MACTGIIKLHLYGLKRNCKETWYCGEDQPAICRFKAEHFGRFTVIIKCGSWAKVLGTYDNTQGDSGGNVNVLGSDNKGYCDKKIHIIICLILNGYQIELSEFTNTKTP